MGRKVLFEEDPSPSHLRPRDFPGFGPSAQFFRMYAQKVRGLLQVE
jgi:hypothetical protein